MNLCSTWICVLQKVPCGGFSECERTYYGLMGTQRHFTVISTSSQQTNTHQKASSPRSDNEMQSSSASIVTVNNSEEQITLCDESGPSGITHITHISLTHSQTEIMMKSPTHVGISICWFPNFQSKIKHIARHKRKAICKMGLVMYTTVKRWQYVSVLLPAPSITHKLLQGNIHRTHLYTHLLNYALTLENVQSVFWSDWWLHFTACFHLHVCHHAVP